MLVLSRYAGEAVVLQLSDGREIDVIVVRSGERVHLGFVAPDDVLILREELLPADDSQFSLSASM